MSNYRLTKAIIPIHYNLQITPDFSNQTFAGSVSIDVNVKEPTSTTCFNAHCIEITQTTIYDDKGLAMDILGTKQNPKDQTHEILIKPINTNAYLQIHLCFCGRMVGITELGFRMTQFGDNGLESLPLDWIASTDLEATGARRVFPCFDDPALKATFSIGLQVDKGLTCLGNMPVQSCTDSSINNSKLVQFQKTPRMSTYIVAFVIGTFDMIESDEFRVPVSIYSPIGYGNILDGRFALDTATKALSIFEKAFDIEFPLPKVNMVAIPNSQSSMENWGLITFIPSKLLVGPTSSSFERDSSMSTVFHELAHQWFGNLVTMDWWDALWLNEGFADWAALIGRSRMLGTSEPFQRFLGESYQLGLLLDSSRRSHPVEVPIADPTDLVHIFDDITYKKGCSVLRMISSHLGEERFLDGVQKYLKKHAYANAQTQDLWNTLQEVTGVDVGSIIGIWTKTSGYPVISVQENKASNSVTITQKRFWFSGGENLDEEMLYPISLKIRTSNALIERLFDTESTSLDVPLDCYKFNADHIGFYRVAYEPHRLSLLGKAVPSGLLSVEDKIGIISDTAALVLAGHPYTRTSNLLDLLLNFKDENNYYVWKSITLTLEKISEFIVFESDEFKRYFSNFKKDILRNSISKHVFNLSSEDKQLDSRLKELLLQNSCGNKDAIVYAQELFGRFINGDKITDNANLRSAVFKIVLENEGEKAFSQLITQLKSLPNHNEEEALQIYQSIGYCTDPSSIEETMKISLSVDSLRKFQTLSILKPLKTHKNGINALWELLNSGQWMQDYSHIIQGAGGLAAFGPMFRMILDTFTTMDQLMEVKKKFGELDSEGLRTIIDVAQESVEAKEKWMKRDYEDILAWLQAHGSFLLQIFKKGVKMVNLQHSLVVVAAAFYLTVSLVRAVDIPASGFVSHHPGITFSLNVPSDGSDDIYFSLSGSSSHSWISVGMGSDKMKGSLMFLLYTSSNENSVTVSPRITDGHTEPSYTSNVAITLLPGTGNDKHNKWITVNAKCESCRKWSGGSLNITSTAENFIYATGPSGNLKTNSKSADTKRHDKYGTFQMDLTKAVGAGGVPAPIFSSTVGTRELSDSTDHDFSSPLHAALMVLVFFGLMPFGVFLLRILNQPRFHSWNMSTSAVLAIIGTGVGIYAGTMYNRSKNWNSPHQILGIIVILAMIGQFLLGFIHHRIYKRTFAPTKLAPYHIWLGRVVIPLGIINGFIGFPQALNGKYDYALLALAICLIGIITFVYWRMQKYASSRKG
ncbi:hypothetical protein B7463_g7812, partial [Scytalidium lignicola]